VSSLTRVKIAPTMGVDYQGFTHLRSVFLQTGNQDLDAVALSTAPSIGGGSVVHVLYLCSRIGASRPVQAPRQFPLNSKLVCN